MIGSRMAVPRRRAARPRQRQERGGENDPEGRGCGVKPTAHREPEARDQGEHDGECEHEAPRSGEPMGEGQNSADDEADRSGEGDTEHIEHDRHQVKRALLRLHCAHSTAPRVTV